MRIFRRTCWRELSLSYRLLPKFLICSSLERPQAVDQENLNSYKAWFDSYVARFYGDDNFVNANLKLKEEHSRRVCDEMLFLCEELAINEGGRQTAETIALLHDVGRFEQFSKYRTYVDLKSLDHARLGLDILRRENVLNGIDDREKCVIEQAIEQHGRMELPAGLDARATLFARLIRDADKLDIFHIVTCTYGRYRKNPDEFLLELELPDEPGYSPEVVEAVMSEQRTDYNKLRTLNDMKLLQLGWVYDVNFTATLKRIKQRKYLETVAGYLPDTQDIANVREKVFAYVDFRIEQDT